MELVDRLFSARDTGMQPSTKLSNREKKVTGQPTIHLNVSRKTKNKNKYERIEKGRRDEWSEIREGRGYGRHIQKKNKKILLLFFSFRVEKSFIVYTYRYIDIAADVGMCIYIYIYPLHSYHGRREQFVCWGGLEENRVREIERARDREREREWWSWLPIVTLRWREGPLF